MNTKSINSVSVGSKINNSDSVIIVKSEQAVYSAVLPPSLMSDGIFSEKIVYFLEVMSFLSQILRKEEY